MGLRSQVLQWRFVWDALRVMAAAFVGHKASPKVESWLSGAYADEAANLLAYFLAAFLIFAVSELVFSRPILRVRWLRLDDGTELLDPEPQVPKDGSGQWRLFCEVSAPSLVSRGLIKLIAAGGGELRVGVNSTPSLKFLLDLDAKHCSGSRDSVVIVDLRALALLDSIVLGEWYPLVSPKVTAEASSDASGRFPVHHTPRSKLKGRSSLVRVSVNVDSKIKAFRV